MSLTQASMPSFIAHSCISRELAEGFWERLPHADDFWGDYAGTTKESFVRLLAGSALVIELPFGLIRVEYYVLGECAHLHGVFWSKAALRSPEVYQEVSRWLRDVLGVSRETIVVPLRRKVLRRLLEQLGFSRIGDIPGYYRTVRGCFDGVLYGKLA